MKHSRIMLVKFTPVVEDEGNTYTWDYYGYLNVSTGALRIANWAYPVRDSRLSHFFRATNVKMNDYLQYTKEDVADAFISRLKDLDAPVIRKLQYGATMMDAQIYAHCDEVKGWVKINYIQLPLDLRYNPPTIFDEFDVSYTPKFVA